MNLLHKTPILIYTPEVPAQAARPAHTYIERVYAGEKSEQVSGSTVIEWSVPYLDARGNVSRVGSIGSSVGGRSVLVPVWRDITRSVPAFPGSQGSPGKVDASSSSGWNSGARSVEPFPVSGYFEFRLPVSVTAIVAGLSGGEFDHSYAHASHAVAFRPTGITPIGHGADLAAPLAFTPSAIVRFERRNGVVSVLVDGVMLHTFVMPLSTQAYADISLYGMGDYVTDWVMASFDLGVDGVIPAPSGISGEGSYATVGGKVPEITLAAELRRAHAVLGIIPAFVGMASEGAYCRVIGRTPAMRMIGRLGAPEASEHGVLGYVPKLQVSARCISGGVGRVDGLIRAPTGTVSEGPYAFVDGIWSGQYTMTSWGEYLSPSLADGLDPVYAADFGILNNAVLIAVYDGISIVDSLELVLIISLEAYDFIGIGDTNTLGGIIQLLARERVAINSGARTAGREAIQYAVNAVTGALTTYEGFGFLQFARCGGYTYAIKQDGLYRIGKNSDAINATIDFGATDFGTSQVKRIAHVYTGATTDGFIYVRLSGDDGVERTYKAVGSSSEQRATAAKGVAARHWRMRLEITEASIADLDSIEVELGVSQRRLAGR